MQELLKLQTYSAAEVWESSRKFPSDMSCAVNGVAFNYGMSSPQYEMADGVRKCERLRRSVSRLKA